MTSRVSCRGEFTCRGTRLRVDPFSNLFQFAVVVLILDELLSRRQNEVVRCKPFARNRKIDERQGDRVAEVGVARRFAFVFVLLVTLVVFFVVQFTFHTGFVVFSVAAVAPDHEVCSVV